MPTDANQIAFLVWNFPSNMGRTKGHLVINYYVPDIFVYFFISSSKPLSEVRSVIPLYTQENGDANRLSHLLKIVQLVSFASVFYPELPIFLARGNCILVCGASHFLS